MSASGGRRGIPIPPWFYTRFPKTRPSLPDAYRAIFVAEYRRNRGIGRPRGAKERLESWMHRQITKSGGPRGPILELGAGGLNHLPWEPSGEAYDIVEPFAELYAGQSELPRDFRRKMLPCSPGHSLPGGSRRHLPQSGSHPRDCG